MALRHTSVPRWPTVDPGLDRTGRAYAVMSFGTTAAAIAAGWQRELQLLGRPVWTWTGESATRSPRAAAWTDRRRHRGAAVDGRGPAAQVPAWRVRFGRVPAELPDDLTEYKGLTPFRRAAAEWLLAS